MYLTWKINHGLQGYTAESLHEILYRVLGRRAYSLLYLPFSERRQRSERYFFVHFVDKDSAVAFLTAISGEPWNAIDPQAPPGRNVVVEPASVQGMGESILEVMDTLGTEGADDRKVLLVWHRSGDLVNIYDAFLGYCGLIGYVPPKFPQPGELSLALGIHGLPKPSIAS